MLWTDTLKLGLGLPKGGKFGIPLACVKLIIINAMKLWADIAGLGVENKRNVC